MTKIGFIISMNFVLVTSLFLFQCNSRGINKSIELNVNNINKNQNSELSERSKEDILSYKEDLEHWIKASSNRFRLGNLKDKQLPNEVTEIRIWSALRYGTVLNCLILIRQNSNWNVRLYWVRKDKETGQFEKDKQGKTIIHYKVLSPPVSGWENLDKFLVEKKIRYPLIYSWEVRKGSVIDDEGNVTLEIKVGQEYGLISYRQLTESKDGKVILDVCSNLEKEFNIQLGCR